ncbi:hypothetical protein CEXT_199091 [Caerostris extrusa]|uniref:RNase H type-1 domain-containing protein n=1 Tax=Caerostris extrusa TaxID=172846 RepID=A0AAV4WV90_CAEEX|nr:hypothetical protein CEXT_199091 [Caerostris extrusa]
MSQSVVVEALLQLFNNCRFFSLYVPREGNAPDDAFASRNSKIPPLTGKSLHNPHFPGSRICQALHSSGRIAPKPIRPKFQQCIWAQKAQKWQRDRETQCVNDIFETEPTKRSVKMSSGEGEGDN